MDLESVCWLPYHYSSVAAVSSVLKFLSLNRNASTPRVTGCGQRWFHFNENYQNQFSCVSGHPFVSPRNSNIQSAISIDAQINWRRQQPVFCFRCSADQRVQVPLVAPADSVIVVYSLLLILGWTQAEFNNICHSGYQSIGSMELVNCSCFTLCIMQCGAEFVERCT